MKCLTTQCMVSLWVFFKNSPQILVLAGSFSTQIAATLFYLFCLVFEGLIH